MIQRETMSRTIAIAVVAVILLVGICGFDAHCGDERVGCRVSLATAQASADDTTPQPDSLMSWSPSAPSSAPSDVPVPPPES